MVASFEAETCGDAEDKIIRFITKPISGRRAFRFRPYAVNRTAWLLSKWRCVLIIRWRRNAEMLMLYQNVDKVAASLTEERGEDPTVIIPALRYTFIN
jgi:hypothetical protein